MPPAADVEPGGPDDAPSDRRVIDTRTSTPIPCVATGAAAPEGDLGLIEDRSDIGQHAQGHARAPAAHVDRDRLELTVVGQRGQRPGAIERRPRHGERAPGQQGDVEDRVEPVQILRRHPLQDPAGNPVPDRRCSDSRDGPVESPMRGDHE
ncbi:hypothetical protein ASG00_13570 [Microbacterium sp. Leaf351]|nr:hypothetical protein ASG00_13570 [Microbacterium sp. Leaf351]